MTTAASIESVTESRDVAGVRSSASQRIVLTGAAGEAADLRARARTLLAGQDEDFVIDALLVLDELVTAAHQAGRCQREARLTITDGPGPRLVIEIEAAPASDPPTRERLGRRILDRLTAEWGSFGQGEHTTIWAAMTVPAPSPRLVATGARHPEQVVSRTVRG